jgi:hypothetical protein
MKVSTTVILAFLTFASSAAAHEAGRAVQDPARGLVYSGLRPAQEEGPCETGFELVLPRGRLGCTHGPDAAPPGLDVRRPRPLGELAASTALTEATTTTATSADPVMCIGDGVEGKRVQAVYAYPASGADHYDAVAPFIRLWAGMVDTVFNDSAAETGGIRHVRYVTGSDCAVDVAKVALSPAGIASLGGTAAELAAQGFDRPDRKYLVWVDAYVYCGLATVKPDDRPWQSNANNGDGQPGMVARVDRGCWGAVNPSIEAHELVHLLGGTQASAPNANDNSHCTDDADVLCYDDDGVPDGLVWAHGHQVPLRSVCPDAHERLLDCGHDDYFHTDPPADNYLATHWNVASSSFLTSEGPPATGDTTAPRPTGPRPRIVGTVAGSRVSVRLRWTSRDADAVGYWLWESVDGGPWTYVAVPNLSARQAVVRLRRGHRYRFLVHAYDASGNASPAAFGPAFSVGLLDDRSRWIAYGGGWRHRPMPRTTAGRESAAAGRGSVARLAFKGRGIAWIARTGPAGGRARVFVDGRYAKTVSLYSPSLARRVVVFSRAWPRSRRHTISVRPVANPRNVSVDAFALLR